MKDLRVAWNCGVNFFKKNFYSKILQNNIFFNLLLTSTHKKYTKILKE
jgi:hypothetical protein